MSRLCLPARVLDVEASIILLSAAARTTSVVLVTKWGTLLEYAAAGPRLNSSRLVVGDIRRSSLGRGSSSITSLIRLMCWLTRSRRRMNLPTRCSSCQGEVQTLIV